jgi:formate dehydrogenase subunit delta
MSYNMHRASIVHVASRLPLGAQDKDTASAKIAEHIIKFWDPRMRRAIVAHLDASSGAALDPAPRKAVETLKLK